MATIRKEVGLDFDDVLLVPQHSKLMSRRKVDISTQIGHLQLKVPVISANMDSITGPEMAEEMGRLGGLGILHRYESVDKTVKNINALKVKGVVVPSVGVQPIDRIAAQRYWDAGADAICVDVAHGDHVLAEKMVEFCSLLGFRTIIGGNVATKQGARLLFNAGANVIKVGVGPGSVCTTRLVTGHGVPQLTAIMDVAEFARDAAMEGWGSPCYVIADGGFKTPGDIVKALAAGADAVMTGSMLAGTSESALQHVYRGMASEAAQVNGRGYVGNGTAEGISTIVNHKGPVSRVIDEISGGIRSGCSYSGVDNLRDLRSEAIFVRVNRIK